MVAARTFHRSQPSTVQSLLLLGYREFGIGSIEHGWLYIGALFNMCDSGPLILKHRIGMAIRMVCTLYLVDLRRFADATRPSTWDSTATRVLGRYTDICFSPRKRYRRVDRSGGLVCSQTGEVHRHEPLVSAYPITDMHRCTWVSPAMGLILWQSLTSTQAVPS